MKYSYLLIIALLLLAGCAGRDNTANPNAQYFTGREGVVTTFENFPTKQYYFGPEDTSGNEFSFGVQVQNKGASFTRGGVYLSGFDPSLLQFQGLDLSAQPRACGISIGHIGFGDFFGAIQCENFGIAAREGQGVTQVRLDSIGDIIRGWSAEHGRRWIDSGFDFSVDYSGEQGNNLMISFNDLQDRIEFYRNGRLFIYVLANIIDFKLNGGSEFLLAGDTPEYPGGEMDYFVYDGRIVSWSPGSDDIQQNLLLTTCYQYTTYADPIVCIDPSPMSEGRKVCTPRSRTWSSNGAPVAITSIEQENTPKKVIFRITVKNIGTGTVFDPGKLSKCSPYYPGRVTLDDLNVVYIGDVRVGGEAGLARRTGEGAITCYPEVVRLDPRTKSGTTTCSYEIGTEYAASRSAFTSPLTVELWYGYREEMQRTMTIKRVT